MSDPWPPRTTLSLISDVWGSNVRLVRDPETVRDVATAFLSITEEGRLRRALAELYRDGDA